ncbi:hypothetical protein [Paenibacillus daejeonensis]|uniref:hypothetical protein n=1 Tax=Paenibacillus daejeonensis TaxID=135193 RepID=UPI0003646D1B|nr:hypothetical protein [Paenibacillus daejeonensis]
MKKKPSYKDALDQLRRSEDFEARTIQKLKLNQKTTAKGANTMTTTQPTTRKRKTLTAWTAGVAACAVLGLGIYAFNGGSEPVAPAPGTGTAVVENQPAPTTAKQMVNIDGIIDEVSADGTSFRIGELWVTVTDATEYGISGPTAPPLSEQLVSEDFKVGNAVSGFTSEDVASGQVTAERIYNNF